jgi:hypothetical protein
VYARIEATQGDDGTREVAVTAYWFQKGHDSNGEHRICAQCTDEKLHDTIDELMAALVHTPPLPAPSAAPVSEPAPVTEPAPIVEARPRPNMLPLGLMAAGGVGIVAGGVLLALDEDPSPFGPQQRTYRNSAPAGYLLTLAGAAALGGGVYLWLEGRKHGQPVAAVTHDTAVVGWTGSF